MWPLPKGEAQFLGWLSLEQSALTTHSLEPGQHRSSCPLCSVLPPAFPLSYMERESGCAACWEWGVKCVITLSQRCAFAAEVGKVNQESFVSHHLEPLHVRCLRRPAKGKAKATLLKAREKAIIVALTETSAWSLDSWLVRRDYVCCWILNT